MVAIIYMVAGLSSRFGGKIKQFARVGPNNETLIEVSLAQAKKAGFSKVIFIVGKLTELPFKEKFGNKWNELPIFYALQEFDESVRDKPWGTVDALVSALPLANEDFVVCNGDDLYGEIALKEAHDFLINKNNSNYCVSLGYKLGKVIPSIGKTNRGIFITDNSNNIKSIKEVFDIEKNKLSEKDLTENTLCSMNLFGLRKEVLTMLKVELDLFKEKNKGDRKIECLLPVELGNLISKNKIKMKLLETNDSWFGVTNPSDELVVKKQLEEYYKK